jgi:ABC-type amino acid transport substrate-binding protein
MLKTALSSLLVAICCLLVPGAGLQAQTRVTYPAPESLSDVRYNDLIEILTLALKKTTAQYGPATIAPSGVVMNEAREIACLQEGKLINVLWTSTSQEKERRLLPVRIPLRKGLLGYRISLIPKDKPAVIDTVADVNGLKTLAIGQGIGWGDIAIYKANGLNVLAANYENLFKMLNIGRFALFPRGLGEVFAEFERNKGRQPNIAVEQHLVIYYPWPYYFFFNKKDAGLAKRVEAGLRIMQQDGSFDALFDKYNASAIARADLAHRRVIKIKNPFLPKATPLLNKSLWFTPSPKEQR